MSVEAVWITGLISIPAGAVLAYLIYRLTGGDQLLPRLFREYVQAGRAESQELDTLVVTCQLDWGTTADLIALRDQIQDFVTQVGSTTVGDEIHMLYGCATTLTTSRERP